MSDVERWLVDKEKEKEVTSGVDEGSDRTRTLAREVGEIREDVSEIQGRVGELGREMAKLATSPANLTSGPSVQQTRVVAPETTTSSFAETISTSPRGMHTPRIPSSSSAYESTSPPIANQNTGSKKTRLPYPTGDYTTPPNATTKNQGASGGSPTGSMSSATGSISGLPGIGLGITGLPTTNHLVSQRRQNHRIQKDQTVLVLHRGRGTLSLLVDLSFPHQRTMQNLRERNQM